jgi:hypothetical protein
MKRLLLLAPLALGLAACGNDDPCAGHSHDPACLVCQGDEDPIPSTVEGDSGNLAVEIVSSDPAPPVNANNTMVVRVLDSTGAAIEGATFTLVEPWYPPGGHGTPVIPEVTESAPGEYTITQVNFLHEGRWELRFDVADGATTDHVVFTLCIEEV